MALHILRGLGPVDLFEALKELLRERGLVDDPLLHVLADNGIAAALGLAVDDLIVREHCSELLAPVNGHVDVLRVTVKIELFEDPLCPMIVFGIARRDHLRPVIIEAELSELLREGLDILLGKAVGMISRRNRVLFRGKTEAVVSHRMKHVVALHALHARYDIRSGVALGMSRVKSYARRVGEHIKRVEFGL